jgi:hypothetical protein
MMMTFELSEYIVYTNVALTALLINSNRAVIVLVFAAILLMTATYSLIIRMSTDFERARIYRMIASATIIATTGLIATTPALLVALLGLIALIIASHEHVSHRSYIPVHRS